MRKTTLFLIACLFGTLQFVQCQEMEAMKKLSRDRLHGYIDKLIDNKSLTGCVSLALALQNVYDPNNNISEKDIPKLTYENGNYWRAAMEKTPRDSSVLYANAYLCASFGDVAYSDIYFLLGSMNVDEATMKELISFKELRDKLLVQLSKEISEGIKLHDEGHYEKAIEIYDRAIAKYPDITMLYYEKGLSYMVASLDANDPNRAAQSQILKDKALESYKKCREKDPFFWKAYQGNDPNVIKKLTIFLEKVSPFYSGQKRDLEAFKAFAQGCEEMELYPFAAHARLKLSLIDPPNADEHMNKFFELVGKSGCKQAEVLKTMFTLTKKAEKEKEKPPVGEDKK